MFPEWHHAVPESAYFKVPETLKTFRMFSISRYASCATRLKHWEQLREIRRQTTKALATSYKSYVNNQIGDSLKTNPKRFWTFIKANKRENIGIPTLRVNDKPTTNDRDKANALNNQFTSVFTSERYPIPVIDHSLYSCMSPLLILAQTE